MKVLPLFCLLLAPFSFASNPDAIVGMWMTDEGDTIEIYKCGKQYCGRIAEAAEPLYPAGDKMAGKPKVDRENPDKKRRNDPIIGLQLMKDFNYKKKDDYWQGGTIYDPNNGKTYKCKATLKADGKLHVRGYIGFAALGRTEVWARK